MKILVIDYDRVGLPFCMRAKAAGHDARLWIPKDKSGDRSRVGDGLIDKFQEWEPHMSWADLILLTDNSHFTARLEPYFQRGFPIVGANMASAALELDREAGSKFLNQCGIKTIPFQSFESYDKAVAYVKETGGTYVCKPWGGNPDKALSYVSSSPADMIFMLERWSKTNKLSGKFMLQKKIKGIEVGVGGWLGPGGFCEYVEENFEHKKLMNDDLGCNTGEQGTVMRYLKRGESELFRQVLEPCEDRLAGMGYVGSVDVNCMVDEQGRPWPLEFTMRCGWPAFNLNMSLHKGDPAEWMAGMLEGQDLLRCKTDVCVGVVLSHGDFPYCKQTTADTSGFPLSGIRASDHKNLWLTSVMMGRAPVDIDGGVKDQPTLVTAGDYVAVVTGHGKTVCDAREAAYDLAWRVKWPSNRMFRTDIGCRLEDQLPALHAHDFCLGMEYD